MRGERFWVVVSLLWVSMFGIAYGIKESIAVLFVAIILALTNK